MGLFDFLRKDTGRTLDELARRLGVTASDLRAVKPEYQTFAIPKHSGGTRIIHAPQRDLKTMQRRILHRVLALLVAHPAAIGFERGKSIVTNANPHTGKAVIVKMDLKDFFPSISRKRVHAFFKRIGWNRQAADWLMEMCTHNGSLPQGAPTSPRLANLVNYVMDKRLDGAARKFGAAYTRYADDLTFSFAHDDRRNVQSLIQLVKQIVEDEGYRLHMKKKLNIRRRHDQQRVTGLVVNDRPQLPRSVRRRLRAAEHRHRTGGPCSLTATQLDGWRSLQAMIQNQATLPGDQKR